VKITGNPNLSFHVFRIRDLIGDHIGEIAEHFCDSSSNENYMLNVDLIDMKRYFYGTFPPPTLKMSTESRPEKQNTVIVHTKKYIANPQQTN
jgi:hypothetical protein